MRNSHFVESGTKLIGHVFLPGAESFHKNALIIFLSIQKERFRSKIDLVMFETQNCSRVHPTFSQMKINKLETDRPKQAGHSAYYTELPKKLP